MQFCGCRRNEKRQTNDDFIGDYRSIYTVKKMRILSMDPSERKQMLLNTHKVNRCYLYL